MGELKPVSPEERQEIAERLKLAEPYGRPRRVWVDDGHVFVESYDGKVVSMTPEVALEMGQLISEAGGHSMVNKVLDAGDYIEVQSRR